MSFKLKCVFLLVTVIMFVNGDIYISHDSSSDSSSESEDDNDKIMGKLKAIYSKLKELEAKVSQLNTRTFEGTSEGTTEGTTEEPLQSGCPNEWTRFKGSCYYICPREYRFLEAQNYCEEMEASLVNIDSELEYGFIKNHLKEKKIPKLWIGLTDEKVEGEWKNYPSGASATFINWATGEPNGGNLANCGTVWESFGYRYVDESCTDFEYRPICEKRI